MHTGLVFLLLCSAPGPACDTLVVCPQQFRDALQPWVEFRTAQGHTLAFASNQQSPEGIRGDIRSAARGGKLRFVVLVGDAEPNMAADARVRARCVPTYYVPAKVNIRWGSEARIATDNWYADLDDDQIPDLAIGRLTADTPDELTRIVRKILDYERNTDFRQWRRQVNFVAGMGGFGVLADAAIDAAAKKLITDGIPSAYSTSMTYANWRSPYCPNPYNFRAATIERLNEGCLFWVYIGHGQQQYLDQLHVPGGHFPILSRADVPALSCRTGAPIACFLACYAGAFDQPQDCLAEEMLRSEGAPVAIVCGSRVTMPYAMAVMGSELLDECFLRRQPTLGEAFQAAKRNMMDSKGKNQNRLGLDAIAIALNPLNPDLAAERAEHLQLFNVIGDPMLSLHHPRLLELQTSSTALAGGEIEVQGKCPVDGRGVVELVVRRDLLTFEPPARDRYEATVSVLESFDDTYRHANDSRWTTTRLAVSEGQFSARLAVPADAHGACHVRAFVEGQADCAMGAANVEIKRPDKREARKPSGEKSERTE